MKNGGKYSFCILDIEVVFVHFIYNCVHNLIMKIQ